MENWDANPYQSGLAEHDIWEVLIRSDFEGFLSQSWEMVANDYIDEGFFGIDMAKSINPVDWKLTFPTLSAYRNAWVEDSMEFAKNKFTSSPREVFYKTTVLENFDFKADTVLVHKVFNGTLELENGSTIPLKWRSLFLLKKSPGWKIAGFCGYMHE